MLVSNLRDYVINPTLKYLGDNFYSKSAVNLLLGTAAAESNLGEYLHQLNGGPALGIYQMEPRTHCDIYMNYLLYHHELRYKINKLLVSVFNKRKNLIFNLAYATAISRVHYYRVSESLPEHDDIDGLANYWKKYYNTEKGKGTVEKFIDKYNNLVLKCL